MHNQEVGGGGGGPERGGWEEGGGGRGELKKLGKKVNYKEILKSIKNRDNKDYNRRISPLKKTKDSVLINTSNLTKSACFFKIKKIIEEKI